MMTRKNDDEEGIVYNMLKIVATRATRMPVSPADAAFAVVGLDGELPIPLPLTDAAMPSPATLYMRGSQ